MLITNGLSHIYHVVKGDQHTFLYLDYMRKMYILYSIAHFSNMCKGWCKVIKGKLYIKHFYKIRCFTYLNTFFVDTERQKLVFQNLNADLLHIPVYSIYWYLERFLIIQSVQKSNIYYLIAFLNVIKIFYFNYSTYVIKCQQ